VIVIGLLLLPGGTASRAETASAGVSAPPLTLEEAIRIALTNHPDLRVGAAQVEAAMGRAEQAGLWSNPALSVSAEEIPVSSGSFRDSKNTVGLEQTVPFPGKKGLEKRIGNLGVRRTAAGLELRRRQLVREVKQGYYRVLAGERLVEVSRDLVRVAESSALGAGKRVEAGAAGDQEQLRAELQFEQARQETAEFERDLALARHEFAVSLGQPERRERPLAGALAEVPAAALLDETDRRWMAGHPRMIAARRAVEQSELELRRAKLEPYPDVTVGFDGGREGPDDTAIVEFRVSVPLPVIDRSRGGKRERRALVEEARAEVEAEEHRLLREWADARARLRVAAEQAKAYRERILPKADEALRLVRIGFEQGKFGLIDLLDTQRTAAEARLASQKKLLELNLAQAELESLVGSPAGLTSEARSSNLAGSPPTETQNPGKKHLGFRTDGTE
jgi:cobalt-zinc-cadmium efflux system outer membrane protein